MINRDLQRQFHDMLMESQWWSAEALRDYQRSQLAQLLHHAKAHVPFYATRLDPIFGSDGTIDWDRWLDLPIVTRRDMVDHREAMQARELPPGHGPTSTIQTSGSTGLGITVTVNQLSSLANTCLRYRSFTWAGLDWSKRILIRDGSDPTKAALPDGMFIGPWGPPWDATARLGKAWVLNKYISSEGALRFAERNDCSYVNTGPKTAHAYALEARRLGLDMHIDAFTCQGGAADESDRQICEEVFGARIIAIYSSKEGGQMAHPCEHGRLHVNSESLLLEIINDEGRPCAEGETGRVVVTPFFSTGQPLIRYEQGDMAVAGEKCPCGRAHPVIGAIVGRQVAMFVHPDGRAVAQILPFPARDAIGCEYVQIAQVGPLNYEVRYVPKDWNFIPEETEFSRLFREAFFDDASLVFKRVEEIPLTAGGKFLEYVNEYKRPS